MIPRTVLMAQEVAAQLTPTQLEDLGNVILNGYQSTVANTSGKLAWQYKETTSPPAPLPDVVTTIPMLRGWTNNYQEYYTNLQPNGYGVNPGDPTMFSYSVNSFAPQRGPIKTTGWISTGSGYTLGTYTNIALTGGGGTGARANIVVGPTPGVIGGPVTGVSLSSGGSGYTPSILFTDSNTIAVTGVGAGLKLDGATDSFGAVTSVSITSGHPGLGYEAGDVVKIDGGNARVIITSVSITGSVTSFTLTNPGNNYIVNQAVSAIIPGGSGFYVPITEVTPLPNRGGMIRFAQVNRRYSQNNVQPTDQGPTVNNPAAIQYSFIAPVANNPKYPPIGWLVNPPPTPQGNGGGTIN